MCSIVADLLSVSASAAKVFPGLSGKASFTCNLLSPKVFGTRPKAPSTSNKTPFLLTRSTEANRLNSGGANRTRGLSRPGSPECVANPPTAAKYLFLRVKGRYSAGDHARSRTLASRMRQVKRRKEAQGEASAVS